MSDFVIESFADPRYELARRVSGGIEVTLFWSPHDNSTMVEVWQPAAEELFVFDVAPERALEAYYHPFAELAASLDELVPVPDAVSRGNTPFARRSPRIPANQGQIGPGSAVRRLATIGS